LKKGRTAQLFDAADGTIAREIGGEERVETVLGDGLADDAGAQRQHVGIVVLAAQAGGGLVVAEGGANAGGAVDGNGDADAGAADDAAAVGLAGGHRLGHRLAEIGIVDRGGRILGAEIQHLVSGSTQLLGQLRLKVETSVIGADCDRLECHGRGNACLSRKNRRTLPYVAEA